MNAESTVFRASRPAVVVAPGGEGARAAAWLLAWPMRLAATPLGRRLLAAATLAVVAVVGVGWLYDSADQPRVAATFRPAGLAAGGAAGPGPAPPAARARRRRSGPRRRPARPRWPPPGGRPARRWPSTRSRRSSSAGSAPPRSRCWWWPRRRVADAQRLRDRPQGPSGWKVP